MSKKRSLMVVEAKSNRWSRTERDALRQAIETAGSLRLLAEKLGITKQSIHQWKALARIPADYIVEIERATGVPREQLRPDLYR